MDGLLIDSEALYLEAMSQTARERGVAFDRNLYVSLVGHAGPECVRKLSAHYGADFDIEGFWQACGERCRRIGETGGVSLKPGAAELFDALDALGLPRALCTSSRRHWVDHHLAPHGLIVRFDALVSGEDCARHKPHPDPYLEAARRLGADPGFCLALEDSHNGVRSAAAAGMMTVMVPDMLEATEEMRALCLHVADSLHAVRALLTGSTV
jgi:HAD superfamily hydrolase (TIGR01509 family)